MFRVELFRKMFGKNSEILREEYGESTEKVRRKYGESTEKIYDYELSNTQKKMISLLLEDEGLSAVKIAKQLGLGNSTVEKNMKKLKEKGLLIRHGSPKNGYWEVVKKEH